MVDRAVSRRTLIGGAAAGTAAALVPATAAKAAGAREQRVEVAIVGAGAAGLYAADVLKGRRSLVILEANPRIGGRLLNGKIGPGRNDIAELGGEWISTKQRIVRRLLRRYHLGVFPTYSKGQSTLILDGQVSRFDTIPDLPIDATAEVAAALLELTAMAAEVPVNAPWNAKQAEAWDSMTGQTWIDDNVDSPVAATVIEVAIGGPTGVRAADVSLLHYLFIAQAAGGPRDLITQGEGVLQYRVVQGTARMVEGLAKPLRPVTRLNTPVTMIERGSRTLRVTTPDGVWVADRVIIAMAPTMTAQILFDPVLPVARNQSVQRAGMGDTIKAFAVYPTPFWRKKGYNGTIQSNSTVFNAAFDNTPARPGAPGVLLALVENNEARRIGALPKAQRQREVTAGFAKAFGGEALHPTRYVDQDWARSRGSAEARPQRSRRAPHRVPIPVRPVDRGPALRRDGNRKPVVGQYRGGVRVRRARGA